jgi:hypothetical protein
MTTTTLVYPNPITLERVSNLINSKAIDLKIAEIDLEMVKMKLRDHEEGQGWSFEQCDSAEIEYKRFLHLNLKYKKAAIVPNKIMDTMWHYHILDTRAYHKDSESIFGGYFYHFPYFGMRGEQDARDLEKAFDATKEKYEKEFGESMIRDAESGCWHDCESRCWHACKSK